ncbi:amidohydrolase family protein [Azohydromonas lata]|uniref:Amidohydrolase family protein n=1 Tax=Azohydromonas lata TaxID=45677 RepID=A0ABU5IAN9_9BURK|nr:amidohydrolase family protein [Azohydromonas lata]MDZ5456167.1 amidohydrolase family protein [Azohydromonas lata]
MPHNAMPFAAVDAHFHVIAPQEAFPQHLGRSYTAAEAPLERWRQTLGPLGVTRGVVVQPSFYGTDNRVLLRALAEGGGDVVGIAAVGADVGDAELAALVQAGVRGVRMAHFELDDPRRMGGFVMLADALAPLAPRLRAHGLHLQLLTDSRLLADIAPALRAAGVPVVLDHMGRTPAALGVQHAGMHALCALMDEGWLWVKLSGAANISQQPGWDDAGAVHRRLLAANAQRLVWGSDWPHTRSHGAVVHTGDLWQCLLDWTPNTADRRRVLHDNPKALYGLK